MSNFWQAMILAVLPILVAGRVAVTRTGRLRKDLPENLDLLGKLPANHPNRATLEAHNGELLGLLVRRQQRRYEPFTQAGVSLGVSPAWPPWRSCSPAASALLATGVLPHPRLQTRRPPGTSGPQQCSSWSWRLPSPRARLSPPAGSPESTLDNSNAIPERAQHSPSRARRAKRPA